jgi:hypothetical protein
VSGLITPRRLRRCRGLSHPPQEIEESGGLFLVEMAAKVLVDRPQDMGIGRSLHVSTYRSQGEVVDTAIGRTTSSLHQTSFLESVDESGCPALGQGGLRGELTHLHLATGEGDLDQSLVPGARDADLSAQGLVDGLRHPAVDVHYLPPGADPLGNLVWHGSDYRE